MIVHYYIHSIPTYIIYTCNTTVCGRKRVNVASMREFIKVQWDEKYKAFKGYNRQFMRTSVSTLYDTS